jgi:haloalkane dehalogenase
VTLAPGPAPAAATLTLRPAARTRRQPNGESTVPSSAFPFQKQRAQVLGRTMAYVDVGEGDPVVLLHGNPTSSYLWRNVLPHLQGLGRCVAPDLIGMGDSDKLPESGPASYTFVEHRRYLDALLQTLDVEERVTFVVHDWGSALGFDWANRHRDAVRGLAYMEAIVRPFTWAEFDSPVRPVFEALRSPAGERLVLEENLFVERLLPGAMLRPLGEAEMAEYRRPFATPGEGRRPTLTWPRQIPLDGEPADVAAIVGAYADWLPSSSVPKLFVRGDPGTYGGAVLEFCRKWRAQSEVTVRGVHYLQEDSPDEIGQAVAGWLRTLPGARPARSPRT